MRKNIFGWHLKRDTNERKALFKGLASALVLRERIVTTEAKAKAIKPYVEKLVTRARKGIQSTRMIEPYLTLDAVNKMMQDVAPRFINRPGGYVRIVHAGNRIADNAPMVMMEWVEKRVVIAANLPSGKNKKIDKSKSLKKVEVKESRKDLSAPKEKAAAKVSKKQRTIKKEKKA